MTSTEDRSLIHRSQHWRNWWPFSRLGSREYLKRALRQFYHEQGLPPATKSSEKTHADFLLRALEFSQLTVQDVMAPRADIVGIDVRFSLDNAIRWVSRHPYSRYPVYEGTIDNTIGFTHVKDLFACLSRSQPTPATIAELVRPVLVYPPSTKIEELLVGMRQQATHLALIIDEYGGVDGLVTIEDLIERLIGDITDEHDPARPSLIYSRSDGRMIVDARMPIDEFFRQLDIDIDIDEDEHDVETVGGLMMSLVGRMPRITDRADHKASNLTLEVIQATPRRLLRILVSPTHAKSKPENTTPADTLSPAPSSSDKAA